MKRYFKLIGSVTICLLALVLLAACTAPYSELPAGTVKEVLATPGSETAVNEDVALPSYWDNQPPAADYLVGNGDVLAITINGVAATVASEAAGGAAGPTRQTRVDGNGMISLPYVGRVQVAGLSQAQIETELARIFSKYIKDVWVLVDVVEYRSQQVYLLGSFINPGPRPLDRPTTLLRGLAVGGGVTPDADLTSARLIRDNKVLPVDFLDILKQGNLTRNVWLRADDTIYIPDNKSRNVFIFGAVGTPGMQPMPGGNLTLGQSLAAAGVNTSMGNIEQIRIIRSLSPTRGQLLVVSFEETIQGQQLAMSLKPGDIVFVPRNAIGDWNETIREILPSLQLFSGILEPFVQIKFLGQ